MEHEEIVSRILALESAMKTHQHHDKGYTGLTGTAVSTSYELHQKEEVEVDPYSEYGPEIDHDGTKMSYNMRPSHILETDDLIAFLAAGGLPLSSRGRALRWNWEFKGKSGGDIIKYRLKKDHYYYTFLKYNEENPDKPMVLWTGGETAPGKVSEIIMRNGGHFNLDAEGRDLRWEHNGLSGDIIGYRLKVDDIVLAARTLVETTVRWSPQTDMALQSGKNDDTPEMKIAIAAIKLGQKMAKEKKN